ncbi:hypothetical protein LCL96_12220 [Rossellomorea aquimaris]|nr:hypothetical protein [Rossellomorea aquimaris]MCA1059713.1 hypothetical protein [Rossellomorea aquimaris]
MLGFLSLPLLCIIIIGGSYAALRPIGFYTPQDQEDPFENIYNNKLH